MKKTLIAFILLLSSTVSGNTLDIQYQLKIPFQQITTIGSTDIRFVGEFSDKARYSYGTATQQADIIYVASATIASAASVTIDLESLIDFQGNSFAFDKIRLLAIKNASGSALSCSGDWLNGETISEHDTILKSSPQAGYSVLSGAGTLILNSANVSICDIIIVGTKQ